MISQKKVKHQKNVCRKQMAGNQNGNWIWKKQRAIYVKKDSCGTSDLLTLKLKQHELELNREDIRNYQFNLAVE